MIRGFRWSVRSHSGRCLQQPAATCRMQRSRFQSCFMSTTVHLFAAAASSAISSFPKCDWRSYAYSRSASVWWTIRTEPCAGGAERRPLQHFEIAVGVSECRDRTTANVFVEAGFPALSSIKFMSGSRKSVDHEQSISVKLTSAMISWGLAKAICVMYSCRT